MRCHMQSTFRSHAHLAAPQSGKPTFSTVCVAHTDASCRAVPCRVVLGCGRIITAHGIKDLDSGTLEKFGMLLSVSQVAGREAWQVGWLTEQEKRSITRQRSGSSPASLERGA
jgi:hypothetical protein